MKATTIIITVKDDARQSEIDAFVNCITVLSEALGLDSVIVCDEVDDEPQVG